MAYQSAVATDLNDLMSDAHTFFLANGWAVNAWADDAYKLAGDAWTGKRLNISKTLGGTAVYVNLKNGNNQRVTTSSDTDARLKGVAMGMSTGYDAGSSYWYDHQNADTHFPVAGGDLDNSILTVFFSNDYMGAIGITSTWGWRFVVFGVTSQGLPFHMGSQMYRYQTTVRPTYLYFLEPAGYTHAGHNFGLRYDSTWLTGGYATDTDHYMSTVSAGQANFGYLRIGGNSERSPYKRLLDESRPVANVGPFLLESTWLTRLTGERCMRSCGNCPDVAFLNMNSLTDASQITVGGDDWRIFLVDSNAGSDYGIALKE